MSSEGASGVGREDATAVQANKRIRRLCKCGYEGCSWSETDQNIHQHTKQKHGDLAVKKIYIESQFGLGGQTDADIVRLNCVCFVFAITFETSFR